MRWSHDGPPLKPRNDGPDTRLRVQILARIQFCTDSYVEPAQRLALTSHMTSVSPSPSHSPLRFIHHSPRSSVPMTMKTTMERLTSDKKAMQQTQRPVAVPNPYLRNNRTTPAAGARGTAPAPSSSSSSSSRKNDGNAYPYGQASSTATTIAPANGKVAALAAITPKPIRSSNFSNISSNPYQKCIGIGGTRTTTVTPTPKKHSIHTIATVATSVKLSSKAISTNPVPRRAPNSTRPQSEQLLRAAPPTKQMTPTATAQPMNTKGEPSTTMAMTHQKKQPTTLKSQLKSQIAQLHRQKRQFLEQKEAEKQRLLREQEKERLRIEREKEMKRLAAIKERERRKVENEKLRKNIGYCLDDMVKTIERRMEIEQKYGGAHFAIGETMEYMVKSIESKDKLRLKAQRGHQLRAKEVRMCLGSMIYAVEQRMQLQATGASNTMGGLAVVQQQQHPSMMMNYPSFPQQAISYYGMHHPPMVQATMTHHPIIQGGYHPQAMQSFPYFSQHHPHVTTFPSSSMAFPHTSNQYSTSRIVPPNACNPMMPINHRPQPVQSTPTALLHSSPDKDPYSPYAKSHHVLSTDIVLAKESAGDSFGVTLRWECKSVLVPTDNHKDAVKSEESEIASMAEGGDLSSSNNISSSIIEKKQRRKRVNYGVVAVVDATKGKFVTSATLQPGDIILSINGRSTGELTFTDACRAIGTTSTLCPTSGLIQCVLKVLRINAMGSIAVKPLLQSSLSSASQTEMNSSIPVAPTISMIPFHAIEGKVISGEFTTVEWTSLIQGLSEIPYHLFSGMALISVTQKEVLASILKSDKYGNILQRRNKESLEAKLAYETRRVSVDMQKRAAEHWARKWEAEQQQEAVENDKKLLLEEPLTDAQRSALREAARPTKGCKCGSMSHEFVNDPNCPLYRDVRQYCEANSITYQVENPGDARKKSTAKNSIKAKNSMEKAYIDRFVRIREANAADREEAEFVLEMEKIQSSMMKKAVLAPPSLCSLVLSAVASLMDKLDDGEMKKVDDAKDQPPQSDSDDSVDSDDDEAVPLNSLGQTSLKRTSTNANSPPPSKRPKSTDDNDKVVVPSPYSIAEILKHVSATHGHLFQGKSHIQYANGPCTIMYTIFLNFVYSFYYRTRTFPC
jgi:hypothetical protein